MMFSADRFERKLQLSGILLILGLIAESLCLLRQGPIPFIVFLSVGGVLMGCGILVYLYSLVSSGAGPKTIDSADAHRGLLLPSREKRL